MHLGLRFTQNLIMQLNKTKKQKKKFMRKKSSVANLLKCNSCMCFKGCGLGYFLLIFFLVWRVSFKDIIVVPGQLQHKLITFQHSTFFYQNFQKRFNCLLILNQGPTWPNQLLNIQMTTITMKYLRSAN
jgi:hypothetical protein